MLTILDEVILGQANETASMGESLGNHEGGGYCKLLAFDVRPTVDILEKSRERSFFKRFLEVLVPSDKLVEDADILLHVGDFDGFLGIEDREGGGRCAIVDIAASGLEETADEQDFEEGICILEKLELATCCD
jgi:hypothetical protein